MEGGIDVNAVLDYVVFHTSSTGNRYEARVCSQGKSEKLSSGHLNHLASHLPEARLFLSNQPSDSFKLQLNDSLKRLSWFTKSTLTRFLHLVNAPEVLQVASTIENEISQLEETRKFHLTLYAKDNGDHSGGRIAENMHHNLQNKDDTASLDATKNELLRAMDSRLLVLKEELVATFSQAAGATCSAKQISDLTAFAQHFGAVNLRNSLLKLLSMGLKVQPADPDVQSTVSDDPISTPENETQEICPPVSQTDVLQPFGNSISPAKIAQAERHSSTESDESSHSSDEDHSFAERSRPLIRSATPRRSASPMRRIQIGRSGSRRSTALTIKSLTYFPVRERASSNRDTEVNDGADEESDQPSKKPENTVRRMSVQDAINLFENKQKDQNLDIQKRRALEVSSSMNKSVLRRWSAGTGDSLTPCSQESTSDASSHNASNNLVPEAEKKSAEVKVEYDDVGESPNPVQGDAFLEQEKMTSPPADNPVDLLNMPNVVETNDQAAAAAEWNRQKEAELNQMLMKMMENKPGKYRGSNPVGDGFQDISSEQRGGLYSQYKVRRDEKLRAENDGKRAAKEAQFKVMQRTLEQSKAQMASKSSGIKGKQDSLNNSQRPRRNSSSPVTAKKEASKSSSTKNASPKTSALPTTRSSWSSGQLPRTTGAPQAKTASSMICTSTTPKRRKSQPVPSPTRPSPRIEKPSQQPKGKKGTVADVKPTLKGQEPMQQKTARKTNRTAKTKEPPVSEGESTMQSAKPSLYSKVTKKSSIVPLESKPFLKKGTGIGPGVSHVITKAKVSQTDESSKNNDLIQVEEMEPSIVTAESTTKIAGDDLVQQTNDCDANSDTPQGNHPDDVETSNADQNSAIDTAFKNEAELPIPEIQPDVDLGISSAAWVEAESQGFPSTCENGLPGTVVSPQLVPVPSSSPRIRHSLSQMLQADSCEPEIIEWGNAENPPALVYQKDAPKGFKRLLKFARKSKGESNMTGWATPSVFSEGEDDQEESKAASKKNSDALLRKATLQAKSYGQQNTMLSESFDGGNSSKRLIDKQGMPHIYPAQSSMTSIAALGSKSREGHASGTVSTKGAVNQVRQSFDNAQHCTKTWWR